MRSAKETWPFIYLSWKLTAHFKRPCPNRKFAEKERNLKNNLENEQCSVYLHCKYERWVLLNEKKGTGWK
jgi:hypothetical protein